MTLHVRQITTPAPVEYPETDGQPMAEHTTQFDWISILKWELEELFGDDPNTFVAGDLFWYPVEGNDKLCMAPDVMVAFGRPKGARPCYLQWKEGSIAPQVVMEVLSPHNRPAEMLGKRNFHDRYGSEEYYVLDPHSGTLEGWKRVGSAMQRIPQMQGWVSPRLGVRFESYNGELQVFGPDDERFTLPSDWKARAKAAQKRADKLAAKLRSLGVDPDDTASP